MLSKFSEFLNFWILWFYRISLMSPKFSEFHFVSNFWISEFPDNEFLNVWIPIFFEFSNFLFFIVNSSLNFPFTDFWFFRWVGKRCQWSWSFTWTSRRTQIRNRRSRRLLPSHRRSWPNASGFRTLRFRRSRRKAQHFSWGKIHSFASLGRTSDNVRAKLNFEYWISEYRILNF